MEKITTAAELKLAIKQLEFEQTVKGNLLKEEVHRGIEYIKPINIIKRTVNEVKDSPVVMDKLLGQLVGMFSGYVSKKIAVGGSHSVVRRILGTAVQHGVTNLITKNTVFKTISRFTHGFFKPRNA